MGVNGMRKGKVFERVVAKLLGQAICGTEKAFIRMPLHGRSLEKFEGDIIPNPEPTLPDGVRKTASTFLKRFMIDAKDRKGWTFEGMVESPKCPVWEWWSKLVLSAHAVGKVPLLIVKYRGKVWAGTTFGIMMHYMKSVNRRMEVRGESQMVFFPWGEMQYFDRTKLEVNNEEVPAGSLV